MNTHSGILELPQGTEGRIRQLEDRIIENQSDPFVPMEVADRYRLRQGQRLTVNVISKKPRRRRGRGSREPRPIVNEVINPDGTPNRGSGVANRTDAGPAAWRFAVRAIDSVDSGRTGHQTAEADGS